MKKLLLTSSFLLLTSYFAPAATGEAEGRAPGDMKTARKQALADALREAVRVETGVDVPSTRLDNMGLGQEITKATGGRMKLDRSTENFLAFKASGSKSVPDSATGAAQGDAPADNKTWWKVW
jgi:hypothetical protein